MAIKWLSGDYPLHEIVFVRGLVAILITLAIFVPLEGSYRNLLSKRLPLHLLRGLSLVIGNMTFFAGLAALPLAEAVAIYTIGGARALRLDDQTGTIETGKLADLIILDQNIFEIPIEDVGSTQIDCTYFEGQPLYEQK